MAIERFSRAQRRAERERLIRYRSRTIPWLVAVDKKSPSGDHARAARAARTPRPCSCWMCGNPRKFWGKITLNEERALLLIKESAQE